MLRLARERVQRRSPFRMLDLVLATSVDLEQFTEDASFLTVQCGTRVTLTAFQPRRDAADGPTRRARSRVAGLLYDLLSGHPWLTHNAIRAAVAADSRWFPPRAVRALIASGLFADAPETLPIEAERSTFGRPRTCSRQGSARLRLRRETFARPRGAGLLKGSRRNPLPRCRFTGPSSSRNSSRSAE